MRKIAIVGAPSSGKTVLARRVANTLSMLGYSVDTALEYARTYLARYVKPTKRRRQDSLDQVMIYLGQKRREDDLANSEIVVCDSATFIPFVWACFWGFDPKDPREVMVVHKLFKWSIQEIASYDAVFLLPPVLEYRTKKKPWKTSTLKERADVAARIEGYLRNAGVRYHLIETTSLEEREEVVLGILARTIDGLKERLAQAKRADA
ncbi:MAG: ATP-binding protein [Planctomycetota bacterium]